MSGASWPEGLKKRIGAALRAVVSGQARQTRRPVAPPPGATVLSADGRRVDPPPPTLPWASLAGLLKDLAEQPERAALHPDGMLRAVRVLATDELTTAPAGGIRDAILVPALTVARRLVRQRRHNEAVELTDLLLARLDPPPSSGLQAVARHARLSLGGAPDPDLQAVVTATLAGADAAVEAGDLPRAAELLDVGAGLLLHRDLHADPVTSPLVEDPESFLEPFRGSRAMALLAAPPVGAPTGSPTTGTRSAAGEESGRVRVVVLTGAYPRFAPPLVDALRRHGHPVEVIELATDHRPFRWIGTDPELVLHRLRASTGSAPDPDGSWGYEVPAEHLDAVRRADVVVADWADKGAVWASVVAPPGARLVVRVHGVDALSLWIHAVNWSRVDTVLAVSAHQAALVDDVLRYGAVARNGAPPRCRPVHNLVTLRPVTGAPERDPWSLGLVGWAKPVKDPLWAVEVLARLRARGGPWRLVLIGEDFAPAGVQKSQRYAARFRERIRQPDVAAAVDLVGRTETVEREVARLGFVLSSSMRESFHLGLAEGVLGGAVPVVRDWPFFASRNGASSLYPREWVVPDVDAAVERIWALRDPAQRSEEAQVAGAEASRRFDPDRTRAELVRLITEG